MAELDNPSIQSVLEHKMNDKIELIIYTDLTDMKQSNLGTGEQFVSYEGITKVVENKVFLYFNGDHNDLRKLLREGIASVYINSMLHGNNLQEIVQNAVLLNLPDWFQEGLISYIGEEWNPRIDSELKDYFTSPKKQNKDFVRLAKSDPRLAGHSMWNYIATTYGKTSIPNILYLTRINRSLENGLLYVLGMDSKQLARQWQDYYEKKFSQQNEPLSSFQNNLDLSKQKWNIPIGQMRLSPHGHQLAYSINDHGRIKVILYDMNTGKKQVLFRYGVRNFDQEHDPNYPVLAWEKEGKELSIVYERRDVIYLMTFDFDNGKTYTDKISPEYHRIYDVDYWSSDTLMFSASTDGLSDLYLYAPVTRESVRLTDDFYDDLDASVVNFHDSRYVLFSSNRKDEMLRKMPLDSLLPIGPFDLFLLNYSPHAASLRRLTFTNDDSERKARMSGPDELICLTDRNGRWQRMQVSRLFEDPPANTIMTRYDRDILQHEYVPSSPVVIDWIEKWNKPYFQTSRIDSLQLFYGSSSNAPSLLLQDQNGLPKQGIKSEEIQDDKYLFQTPFPEPVSKPTDEINIKPEEIPVIIEPITSEDVTNWIKPSVNERPEYKPESLLLSSDPELLHRV
jgi:hypothetical protein